MQSPYINTILHTTVMLNPYQMDNKFYLSLKSNLEENVVGKCFKKYGYVVKVIEITDMKNGIIEAENTDSAAIFDLEFSCRLCMPIKHSQIICKVDKVNKYLITANNGPIKVVIAGERVNYSVFFKDNNNNVRYKKDSKSEILERNALIKITVQASQFFHGDQIIRVIGFLDDMANEEEKKCFESDQFADGMDSFITNDDKEEENIKQ